MKPNLFTLCRFAFPALAAAALTLPAAAQPMDRPDFTVTPAERTAVIEGAIAKLNENYVFPETAKKMEAALHARAAKHEYDSISSAKELAEKLTGDLREISHDRHLHVLYDPAGVPDRAPGASTPEELSKQRQWLEKVNFGFEKAERMRGGAHPVQPYKVSEHFAIGVPFARAVSPVTGTNWEGTGVAPDIAVPADQALDVAYRTALEKMLATASDPWLKEQIQKLLAEKKQG